MTRTDHLAATAATLACLREEGAFALLVPERLGGAGATLEEAVALVLSTAERDGSAAFALGAHSAATAALRTEADGDRAAADALLQAARDGELLAARRLPPQAERLGLRGVPATEPAPLPAVQRSLLDGLHALFDGALAAGLAHGSVEAAAEFTRRRPRPRPVPGVERASADPFSQTLLGEGLAEAWGATALVRAAARELAEALAGHPDPVRVAALGDRALAALEVALTVALAQGERVWQVVGTSGTANALGFDAAWRDARALAALTPRAARRRALGRAELAAA
jgi:alkylation response protein AidB-like acyl-CoA dehydrogenase